MPDRTITAGGSAMRVALGARANFVLMLSGFAAGQGTLFGAQSYLILTSRFDLSVAFTLAFTLASLAAMVVDMGGGTLLARKFVVTRLQESDDQEINEYLGALGTSRFAVWAVLMGVTLVYAFVTQDPLAWFLLPAAGSLSFWCLNLSGILDGMRLSGFSGATAGLPHIFSAVALLLVVDLPLEKVLLVTGIAYGAGTAVSVFSQLFWARRAGFHFRATAPRPAALKSVILESLRFQYCLLPGHVAYRAQFALAEALLPVNVAALFIYGKQAASALLQLVAFMRRISFPSLVQHYSERSDKVSLWEIFRIQRSAIALTLLFMLAVLAARFVQHLLNWSWSEEITYAILITSPTFLSASLFGLLSQCLQAQGRFVTLGTATVVAACVSVLGALVLNDRLGIGAFIWAEVAGHLLWLLPLWKLSNSRRG